MTIVDKRNALDDHCAGSVCKGCPLFDMEGAEYIPCDFTAAVGEPDHWPDELIEKAYDLVFPHSTVDHPNHYQNAGGRECIEEMRLMFGDEAVRHFCMLNAYKYRFRAGKKNGEEDLKKANWYIDYLAKMEGEKK